VFGTGVQKTPRAAMAISACGVWHFRVRRLAFPRAAFETLPAMSKKSLLRKPQEA